VHSLGLHILYYEKRIKLIIEESSTPRVNEPERERAVGVLIHDHYNPGLESNQKYYSEIQTSIWAWFEREVASIMERG
jgi:hypothetical protein